MAIYIEKANLTYLSVPKCACTSVKQFCDEVNTGKPFKIGPNGKTVHDVHPALNFEIVERGIAEGKMGGDLIAVLRHPVDRIVSCFTDKVSRVRAIATKSQAEATARGLPVQPDLETFVNNLEAYQDVSQMINNHSRPLRYFLGDDPKRFSRFFHLDQIDDLRAMINQRAGTSVTTELHKNSSPDAKRPHVTPEIKKAIEMLYAEELEIFGAYFPASKTV